MKKNQAVEVVDNHPYHAGRKGYFQFCGEGQSAGVVVCATKPTKEGDRSCVLFAVSEKDLIILGARR